MGDGALKIDWDRTRWSENDDNIEFEQHLYDVIHSGPLVIDVGCGNLNIGHNVIGVDAYSDSPNVNVQAYMWDMPFDDESVDGLVCMAALEHISKWQVPPTLAEFNRVLKPGAKFIILVPDLIWVLEAFLRKPTFLWELDMIYGTQVHEGEFHRTGFTEDMIYKYFEEVTPNVEILQIYKVNAYTQINLGIVARRLAKD